MFLLWPVVKITELSKTLERMIDNWIDVLDRRWFSFPVSDTSLGWKEKKEIARKLHPIKYWITENGIPGITFVLRRIYDFGWKILHRYHPEHQYNIVRTGLKPGYYDIDMITVEVFKTLIHRYVVGEAGGVKELEEKIAWLKNEAENTSHVDSEISALHIYDWFWKRREDILKQIDDLHTDMSSGDLDIFDFMGGEDTTNHPRRAEYDAWKARSNAIRPQLDKLESDLYDGDTEFATKFIQIRNSLWT